MKIKCWLSITLFLISSSASAHSGDHFNSHFLSGFLHPLSGIDHLLVLIVVGMLAAKKAGKTLILLPTAFLVLMACGMLINHFEIQLPFIESFIALSVVFFSLLLSVNRDHLHGALLTIISCFAIFHGYAHANEIPLTVQPLHYFSTMLFMSLIICAAGIFIGNRIDKKLSINFSLAFLFSGLYFLTSA